jgi:hypothetical protein
VPAADRRLETYREAALDATEHAIELYQEQFG